MKMTIGNKLYAGFGLVILFVAAFSIFVISTFRSINADLKNYETVQKQVQQIKGLQYTATLAAVYRLDASVNKDREMVEKEVKPRGAAAVKLLEEMLDANKDNAEDRKELDKISGDLQTFIVAGGHMFDAYMKSDREGALVKQNEYAPGLFKMMGDIETFVKTMDDRGNEATKEILTMAGNAIRISIVIILLVVIVSLGIAFYTTRIITKPLALVMETAQKIATGDLTEKDIVVTTQDEIGELATVFNKMSANLNNQISQVAIASAQIASSAQELASTAEEMASGAEEQTSQTTQVATSMEEMSATVQQVAKSSNAAAQKAKGAGETANKGGEVVNETVTGMTKIALTVKELQEVIGGLSKNSEKIGDIVGVIDDVADQTNLLALNAAIEAARAGEQGRGFAVVADEVRKLAERTTSSTKEIATMVKSIQEDTTRAVGSMDQSAKEVEGGVSKANQAGGSLKEILVASKAVQDMVQQIATAAEQQSAAAEEISSNVESIASVSKQNASAAQQTSTASQEMSRLTDELQKVVAAFKLKSQGEAFRPVARQKHFEQHFQPKFEVAAKPVHKAEEHAKKAVEKPAFKKDDSANQAAANS